MLLGTDRNNVLLVRSDVHAAGPQSRFAVDPDGSTATYTSEAEAETLFNYFHETNLGFRQAGENRMDLETLRKLRNRGFTGSQIGGGRLTRQQMIDLVTDVDPATGNTYTVNSNPKPNLQLAQTGANRYTSSGSSASV